MYGGRCEGIDVVGVFHGITGKEERASSARKRGRCTDCRLKPLPILRFILLNFLYANNVEPWMLVFIYIVQNGILRFSKRPQDRTLSYVCLGPTIMINTS